MRLHVLGFPFSELTKDWSQCAFTSRTVDFCNMMTQVGWEVVAYGGEEYDVASEHVSLTTREEQRAWFPDYDPKRDVFNSFDPQSAPWHTFNERAADDIRRWAEPGDVVCHTMGHCHKPVADALSDLNLFHVETGIGYSGVWAPYRIFESWAWRHYLAARERTDDVRFYDAVLPRAFNVDEYPQGDGSGGYYLFMGRLIERKGPHIAALACQRIGAKLLVAGQGDYPLEGDVEYLGVLGPDERAEVMGKAIGVFCPSLYLEPFCGVSVEAQLTGTPVIASNWGGLVENVDHGETGFLCDTLADFAAGAESCVNLDRDAIHKRAVDRWSTEVLGPQYGRYFERLSELHGEGWYS